MNSIVNFSSFAGRCLPIFFSLLLFFSSRFASAAEREFSIEPIPDWATVSEIEDRNNQLEQQATGGLFFLLFNVEVNAATGERFIHIAQKFLSSAGVEGNSHLSFTFDPAYQQLVFHKILVHRGNRILNQLEPDRIRVIQQEKDLDRLIYNGSKSALLFLEDVRVGDWVEFAYTVRGRNPIEAGHFFDSLQLSYPFPIQTENFRLLWPRTNPPLWAQTSSDAPQNRRIAGEFFEYAWHWENRPGKEREEFVPSFVLPQTTAHFSDYRNWEEVGRWAEKWFRPETVTDELYQKIAQIRDGNKSDEERVLAALQFVQDEIRYLGIENGVNSHQPNEPSVVFARGYGDCKDKALLFCTMLRFFEGVDASPVLVSTRFRKAVEKFIATPLVFDHVVVRLILNGQTNFVDVTRSFQRGPLNRRFIEDFGVGVLLDERRPGLIAIPPSNAGMPLTRIDERFDVSASGATDLLVTSTYEGRDADFIREALASMNPDLVEKNSLGFYQKYYSGIVTTGRQKLHDDEELNRIQITRKYFIPNIWRPALQSNVITCEFVPHGIYDRLYIPSEKKRRLPLAVPFPANSIHTMHIIPHEPWQVTPRDKTIRTSGFLFHNKLAYTNNEIQVTSQILSLSSAIAAADMPEFWEALDRIPNQIGLAITKPVAGKNNDPNWTIWLAGIFYSAVLLIVAMAIYRYKPKTPPEIPLPSHPELQGLGGWLIVLGVALFVAPLLGVVGLIRTGAVYSASNWRAITNPAASGYDSMIAPLLLFELFFRLTLIAFFLLLIVLYFRKKRIFGTILILCLSFQFIGSVLDESLAASRKVDSVTTYSPKQGTSTAARTLWPLIIWGLYVSRSKRVKMTFLN